VFDFIAGTYERRSRLIKPPNQLFSRRNNGSGFDMTVGAADRHAHPFDDLLDGRQKLPPFARLAPNRPAAPPACRAATHVASVRSSVAASAASFALLHTMHVLLNRVR
jgi:hypothetical protein